MDSFSLALFPEGSLSASVVTTVWVGVLVVSFFNLRLGWTFSGLVVPGYLVPLLITKPWVAVVVCLEGMTAYAVVWFLSEVLSRTGLWCPFFGRDRFFALLLAGVAVRITADGWLLPLAGTWLNERFGLEFDYHNNLNSYGLIVGALIANQFWKTGLVRGLGPFLTVLGLTYVLVRFGLMEWTNFNIGNLQYMYEDLASSLPASPKAYIILLTTALLASWMNLRYSWEFNGILLPALFALLWYEPFKVLTSVTEAATVYFLACLVLRAPGLRQRSFEGAQKLCFFFTLAFAYKMLLGFLLPHWLPGARVSDYFGFGYLLSTLLALKAHDKGIALRLGSATFQISILGAVAGSLIGFALTLLPLETVRLGRAVASLSAAPLPADATLGSLIQDMKLDLLHARAAAGAAAPLARERDAFARGLRELLAYAQGRDPERLRRARAELDAANYRVDEVQQRYLCLREKTPRGWGLFVLALDAPGGLVIDVPAPVDEWAAVDAGVLLFRSLGGKALAVAGVVRSTGKGRSSDLLQHRHGIYETFHRLAAAGNVLRVRGLPPAAARSDKEENSLWVTAGLPAGLNLAALKELIGPYEVHWRSAPRSDAAIEGGAAANAELFLTRAARRALRAGSAARQRPANAPAQLERITGSLRPWLLASRTGIAEPGTNLFRPARTEELLLFDEEVLTPLLRVLRLHDQAGRLSAEGLAELHAVAVEAATFGYRLLWWHDPRARSDYLILAEREAPAAERRYWGTYVFRAGAAKPYVVQVPRPLFERNSFEYGLALFDRLEGCVLQLAGAHPEANQDRSADVLGPRNKACLFNLVGQAVLREAGPRPLMLVQSRAFGVRPTGPMPRADVLLAFADGAAQPAGVSELGKEVLAAVRRDRLDIQFVGGSAETVGYEATSFPQASYLAQSANKELVLVWLSPLARALYRQQVEDRVQEAQFQAVGIPTVQRDLYDHLAAQVSQLGPHAVPAALRQAVERYIARADIVLLEQLRTRWPDVRFERVIDTDSQQAFLLLSTAPGRAPLVANLGVQGAAASSVQKSARLTLGEVKRYVESRTTWLELGGQP